MLRPVTRVRPNHSEMVGPVCAYVNHPREADLRCRQTEGPTMNQPTRIGFDVHNDTTAVAVTRPDTIECNERVIPNTSEATRRLISRYPDPSRLSSCYEVDPTGHDTRRLSTPLGIACDVIAPSLLCQATDLAEAYIVRALRKRGSQHIAVACSFYGTQPVGMEISVPWSARNPDSPASDRGLAV